MYDGWRNSAMKGGGGTALTLEICENVAFINIDTSLPIILRTVYIKLSTINK